MNPFLTLSLLFLSSFIYGQSLSLNTGTTRAVVIGISDYENEKISDLKHARKDAEVFLDYLKSPVGGSIPDKN
ncbi:hypothetical protein OAF63_04715 [Saprospiraceae bacterium]|jgi:Na+-translocating ferredoxin:NAD+ oxidoreductase RnfC subunit|nr:hypothetical protein [Bacteroidota bacterium]MDB4728075.1 hypothetical protein [Saprospiraceae bacterium]MDF1868713.1 hypothetical protein [Saprospiraceae bacterium]